MKTIYYIDSLSIGGAETQVANQVISLKKNGIDVVLVVHTLLDTHLEKMVIDNGVDIVLLPKINLFAIDYLRKIPIISRFLNRKSWSIIINNQNPDLICINTSLARIYGIDFNEKRLVYVFHSEVERTRKIYGNKNFKQLKCLSKKGMHFFALTNHMLKDIYKAFGPCDAIEISNFVDICKLKVSGYEKESFLPTIHIPPDAFIVGHVGRFHPVKNHERIIKIFYTIRKKRRNAFLILVGGYYNEKVNEIKKMAMELDIYEYIRFLGIRDDATQVMNCFDCLLLPSFSESFSLVVLEAQAQGVKCVVSDNVPEEVICNSNCVRLSLEAGDDVWTDAVLSEKKDVINAAKDINQFDIETVSKKTIDFFANICRNNS